MDAVQLTSQTIPTSKRVRWPTAVGLLAVALAGLPGCGITSGGASARLRLDPAATEATHDRVSQRPGLVETLRVVIEPGGTWAPNPTPDVATTPAPRRKRAAQAEPTLSSPTLDETLRAAIDAAASSGSRVTIEHSRTIDASQDQTASTLRDRGAGIDSRGREQGLDVDQRPRRLRLPWGGDADGGGMGLSAELTGSGAAVLYVLGGLCVIAALIPIAFPPRRLGLAGAMAGTGLLLIASATVAEQYPWLMAAGFLAFVGVSAWLAYDAWNSRRKSKAMEPIALAIEAAPNAAEIKRDIESFAGTAIDQVRAIVRPVKKRLERRGAIKPRAATPPVGVGP